MKPPERANIEEKKEEIKEPEQCHLESALTKCGDNCMQEFEDVYNICIQLSPHFVRALSRW